MKDADRIVEVFLDHDGEIRPVGRMRCTPARRRERVLFEYDPSWIVRQDHFAIDQGLPVVAGPFQPAHDAEKFPVLGDSAPDNWGRSLMQRRERRQGIREGRAPRTLFETDYVLGVADVSRIGALRLRWLGDEEFQAPVREGVPGHIALARLMDAARRIDAGEDRDEDLDLILAPGASLGGTRPRCSVYDVEG
jgi:serine/threonine-protein kinase HipA